MIDLSIGIGLPCVVMALREHIHLANPVPLQQISFNEQSISYKPVALLSSNKLDAIPSLAIASLRTF